MAQGPRWRSDLSRVELLPLDARGKKDGFNIIYHLNDLGFPFIYSSLFTNAKTYKEKPALVQKVVAVLEAGPESAPA